MLYDGKYDPYYGRITTGSWSTSGTDNGCYIGYDWGVDATATIEVPMEDEAPGVPRPKKGYLGVTDEQKNAKKRERRRNQMRRNPNVR